MARQLLWNLYLWSAFLAVTLVCVGAIPVVVVWLTLFAERPFRSALRCCVRSYGWFLTTVVPFFAPVEVEYRGVLPPVAIFVSNHNSAIDPYLFGRIPKENGFVTSWPFRIPVYGLIMRLSGYANSEKGWQEVRRRSLAMFADGCSVTIWPEGHRSRNGTLGRFRNGAFSLAMESGYPVVPVCILGSGKILPPGRRFLRCGHVKLIVLPPIFPDLSGQDFDEATVLMRRKVRAVIEKTLEKAGHFEHD